MASTSEIVRWQKLIGAVGDGKPGPQTFERTIAWLNERGYIERDPPAPVPDVFGVEPRMRVVELALGELSSGGLAKEQDPQKYIREAAPIYIGQPPNAKAWCGIFWLWCLRRAGLTSRTWVDGRGFAYGYLPTVSIPEPGDGMYFGKPNHHYAVVRRVANGRVYTVDGNSLPAPREGVSAKDYPIDAVKAGGGCYFSIRNLVAGNP